LVESLPGQGTTFMVSLPISEQPPAAALDDDRAADSAGTTSQQPTVPA